ncbi:MAG TPA: ATP-dependent zinc metalloprotease FtsH [Planctomycetota bacterium]|nr:ATP-dependent zinc metalloprotease FtsH [Planctomycetota bacterium]
MLAMLAVVLMIVVNHYLQGMNVQELTFSRFRDYVERVPAVRTSKAAAVPETQPAAGAPESRPDGPDGADRPASRPRQATALFDELLIGPTVITGRVLLDDRDGGGTQNKEKARVRVARGAVRDDELVNLLYPRNIPFKFEPASDWSSLLIFALPTILIIFILLMMFRSSRMTGENVLSFGRSRAKIVGEDKTGVSFEDVAGADEAKEELKEIVEFLKEPDRFTALGGKIPRGVLLVGAPGCGKTLLARAVAGEAGVPFFSISGSDFVEMFVGVGAARVRDLFNTAKQKAPCIIFVDEIDAVGRHRGAGLGGGHDEREQTLNQLLVEMDGFDSRKGVIILAATNRPDILDPALLRPGRFDRTVVLDAADVRGREAILRIHSRGKPLNPDVDLADVAKRTPGFSGADLANVMNEAALLAARRRRRDISRKEVEEAVERVVAGPERRSKVIGPKEKRILAYHELGHALVARFTPEADPVAKVSIIPRGRGALGYTLSLPAEDRYIITKDQLLARIKVTLGGRTAEELVFGHQSTGAEDDLQKVTQLARALACRFGMTDALGPVAYDRPAESPFLGREQAPRESISERTADLIDAEVRRIVDSCHVAARKILEQNRDVLDALATKLIEVEVLGSEDFEREILRLRPNPPPPPEPKDAVAMVTKPPGSA